MVPNSTGGNAYPVDNITRLQRFLILGSEGGSYYAGERKLTVENTAAVKRCIESNGMEAVEEIASISVSGRASKPGPVLFALAIAASYGTDMVWWAALKNLPIVARTGSHL